MIKKICNILVLMLCPMLMWGQFSVSSNKSFDFGHEERIMGIDNIAIFESIDSSASLQYSFSDSVDIEWHYHTETTDSLIRSSLTTGTIAYLDSLDQGLYELKADEKSYYFSVLDFSNYISVLDSVWVEDEGDSCNTVRLFARMDRVDIPVYDINDSLYLLTAPKTTYKWTNSEDAATPPEEQEAPLEDITYDCSPYADDFFPGNDNVILYKDPDTLSSLPYTAIAIKIGPLDASIPDEDVFSNRLKSSSETEGSAPLDVTYTIDPQGSFLYRDWYIWGLDIEKQPSSLYQNTNTVTHTFEKYIESGYRVKVEVSNEYCHVEDSAEVMVYNSDLQAPNILILGFGAAGKFKVAYQSIDLSTFKATVYDRWGRRIYSWDDPDLGWDGRSPVTNAYVSPGVYYCAVKAKGTDGKKHDDIFEINVLREKGIK